MDTRTDEYPPPTASATAHHLPPGMMGIWGAQSLPSRPAGICHLTTLSGGGMGGGVQQLQLSTSISADIELIQQPLAMEPIPEEEPGDCLSSRTMSPASSYSLHSTANNSATARHSVLLSCGSEGVPSTAGVFLKTPPPPPDTSLASSMCESSTSAMVHPAKGNSQIGGGGETRMEATAAAAGKSSSSTHGVVEQKTKHVQQRLREVHRTEEIDTVVSTIPREEILGALPHHVGEWSSTHIQQHQDNNNCSSSLSNGGGPNTRVSPCGGMADIHHSTHHRHQHLLAGAAEPASHLDALQETLPPRQQSSSSSSRGTKYSYTYESHLEQGEEEPQPPPTNMEREPTAGATSHTFSANEQRSHGNTVEHHQHQTTSSSQRVTRVTKITTTRSVKRVPIDPNDIYFDADGNPIAAMNGGGEGVDGSGQPPYYWAPMEEAVPDGGDGDALGIDLSRAYITQQQQQEKQLLGGGGRAAGNGDAMAGLVPSAPGRPEVMAVSEDGEMVSLAWRGPQHEGDAGELLGYRVEFRRSVAEPWEPAHDDLLGDPECKITNLDPAEMYFFRVLAANPAGFGPPSPSTQPIRLVGSSNKTATSNHTQLGGFNDDDIDYDSIIRKALLGGGQATGRTMPLPPPAPPHQPYVSRVLPDSGAAVVEWLLPAGSSRDDSDRAQMIAGYVVEYRPVGSTRTTQQPPLQWQPANDKLVRCGEGEPPRLVVEGLRPNGDYQFRVLARSVEGVWSPPSPASAVVRMRPEAPARSDGETLRAGGGGSTGQWLNGAGNYHLRVDPTLPRPGAPSEVGYQHQQQAAEGNLPPPSPGGLHLEWTPADLTHYHPQPTTSQVCYLLEQRQLGTPEWAFVSAVADEQQMPNDPGNSQADDKMGAGIPGFPFLHQAPSCTILNTSQPHAYYEFRASTVLLPAPYPTYGKDGGDLSALVSLPSDSSEPLSMVLGRKFPHRLAGAMVGPRLPERPSQPEYLSGVEPGSDQVTLCWLPARSEDRGVLGYEVEFRDLQQDRTQWYKLTQQLVRACKTTVGFLLHGHQYQFRILAANAYGLSDPSLPTPLITIDLSVPQNGGATIVDSARVGAAGSDGSTLRRVGPLGTAMKGSSEAGGAANAENVKYVEAERHATVALLQEEMIRESPPLPDRDDSPPPIYRQPDGANLQWRDPTLKEVIDYLASPNESVVIDASGYLQHLTYNNDLIKEESRQYNAVGALVRLLNTSESQEVLRNACGCLKNLAFGRQNDANKLAINGAGGVVALGRVIQRAAAARSTSVVEEATGALWNISGCGDELKEAVLKQVADVVTSHVVVPWSGYLQQPAARAGQGAAAAAALSSSAANNIFRNGTGILRNISAASAAARKQLRSAPHLIDSLLHFLATAVQANRLDTRSVENTVCLLRNLSYRVQEVVDPKYDPNARSQRQQHQLLFSGGGDSRGERSRSAPAGSPKSPYYGTTAPPSSTTSSRRFFRRRRGSKASQIALPSPPKASSRGRSTPPPSGPTRLWQVETVRLYLRVLQESAEPEVLEAAAAALQNLAACPFDGSAQVRVAVRQEKGLPVLVELLRLHEERVVSAVMQALRNLAIDRRNLELLGRYAMRELVAKLPAPGEALAVDGTKIPTTSKAKEPKPLNGLTQRKLSAAQQQQPSEATLGAVLGLLWEAVGYSGELTRLLHETLEGTERLRTLAKSYPRYSRRVCKYASQVLYLMWQHPEMHDIFRRQGLAESDFYSTGTIRGRGMKGGGGGGSGNRLFNGSRSTLAETATLARPISSQGNERPNAMRTTAAAGDTPVDGTSTVPQQSSKEGEVLPHNGHGPASNGGRLNGAANGVNEEGDDDEHGAYTTLQKQQHQLNGVHHTHEQQHQKKSKGRLKNGSDGGGGGGGGASEEAKDTHSLGGDSWV